MQRKYLTGTIVLGFASAMVLVLALAIHLLQGEGEQSDWRRVTKPLVHTNEIHAAEAGPANATGSPPALLTVDRGAGAAETQTDAFTPEESGTSDPSAQAYLLGSATPWMRATMVDLEDYSPESDPFLDDDHSLGSEPGDSDTIPQDETWDPWGYPPPDSEDDGDTTWDGYPPPGEATETPTVTPNTPVATQGITASATATPSPTATARTAVPTQGTTVSPTATPSVPATVTPSATPTTGGRESPTPTATGTAVTATATLTTTPSATAVLTTTGSATAASATAASATATATSTPTGTGTTTVMPTATGSITPTPTPSGESRLVAPRAREAPVLDGTGGDAAWERAQAVVIETSGGANQSAVRVTLRSVYDDENVYFLVTWADPTHSSLLNPWEKQANGGWQRLTGGQNAGGDENEYYQDQLAMLWAADNRLADFATQGCAGACHGGDEMPSGDELPSGEPVLFGDLWQLKTVENLGQVDDAYLNGAPNTDETPWGSLQGDPGEGGYYPNEKEDHSGPAYMPAGGGDKTGAPGYILDTEKVALDPKRFAPGERLPAVIRAPVRGDRGDIRGGWQYANGAWTLELARKLVTGSVYDVQFDDLEREYFFAVATFDNTQRQHALQRGMVAFRFGR